MRIVRALAATMLFLAVGSCTMLEMRPAPGALTRSEAIEAARRDWPSDQPGVVIDTAFGPPLKLGIQGVGDADVWQVVFSVDERRPCGPAPGGKICHITFRTIVVEGDTGRWLTMTEQGETGS